VVGVANVINIQKPMTALAIIQSKYAILNLSGELRIVDRDKIAQVMSGNAKELSLYRRTEGQILISRELENLPFPVNKKIEYNNFIDNPNTHVYDEVAFSPKPTPPRVLNFWVDPPIKPIKGDWFVIQEFLHTVICNNGVVLNDYLIRYLAHMLQRPHEKPGIMIVFLSGQGCGKGTLYKLVSRIWSRTTLQVCDINQVIGQFNAALERNYVVCMDEALFAGDKKSLDKLKSLVTEPTCRIEQKHQPSRTIDSYHRLFAASNHDHFAHVDKDDRRFLFIRLSSVHKQDQIYFDAVNDALDDDAVIAAMMHDLLNLDLTGFNIRKRPLTEEHLNQRLQSLGGFERYWYEVLQSGMFDVYSDWDKFRFISTTTLIDKYKVYDKNAGRYNPIQEQQIATTLSKLCPSANKVRKKMIGKQERGYDLPGIKLARKEFETMLGTSVEWEELEDVATDAAS
jgi:hypothetical protein